MTELDYEAFELKDKLDQIDHYKKLNRINYFIGTIHGFLGAGCGVVAYKAAQDQSTYVNAAFLGLWGAASLGFGYFKYFRDARRNSQKISILEEEVQRLHKNI